MLNAGDAIWLVWKEGKPACTQVPNRTLPGEASTSGRSQHARRAPGDWWRTESSVYPSTVVRVVSAAQNLCVVLVKLCTGDGQPVAEMEVTLVAASRRTEQEVRAGGQPHLAWAFRGPPVGDAARKRSVRCPEAAAARSPAEPAAASVDAPAVEFGASEPESSGHRAGPKFKSGGVSKRRAPGPHGESSGSRWHPSSVS